MLSTDLQKSVIRFIPYGSRARCVFTQPSDLDLVARADEKMPIIDRALKDINYCGILDYDFNPVIALRDFTEIDFQSVKESGRSFYKHVETKGISI